MPEGDTIHRAAVRIDATLRGASVTAFSTPGTPGRPPSIGSTIDRAAAVGKHLVVEFGDGIGLRTHMGMNGSWHLYRDGERWRRPRHEARVVIEADNGWVAVCFVPPQVELFALGSGAPSALDRLGPDLLGDAVDLDDVLARVGRLVATGGGERAIADVLLDQQVAAGIGNVYKSETLYLCKVDPFRRVDDIGDDTIRTLFATATELLRANLHRSTRVTFRGGLGVYGRARQPCGRCGDIIRMRRQGPHARSTYWCPTCQPG